MEDDNNFLMYHSHEGKGTEADPSFLYLGTLMFDCEEIWQRESKEHLANEFERHFLKEGLTEKEDFIQYNEYETGATTDDDIIVGANKGSELCKKYQAMCKEIEGKGWKKKGEVKLPLDLGKM